MYHIFYEYWLLNKETVFYQKTPDFIWLFGKK